MHNSIPKVRKEVVKKKTFTKGHRSGTKKSIPEIQEREGNEKLNPRIREWEMETIIPGNRKGVERKFGRSEVAIKYHVDLFLINSRRVISL